MDPYQPPASEPSPAPFPITKLDLPALVGVSLKLIAARWSALIAVLAVFQLPNALLGAFMFLLMPLEDVMSPEFQQLPPADQFQQYQALAEAVDPRATLGMCCLGLPVQLVLYPWSLAAAYFLLGRTYVGRPPGAGEALRAVFQPSLLLTVLVLQLGYFALVAVGCCFLILPGLLVALAGYLLLPVLVLEEGGLAQTFARAWKLIQGQWPEALGALFLTVGAAVVLSLPNQIVSVAFPGKTGLLLTVPVNLVSQTSMVALGAATAVALYVSARVDHERFDVAGQAE